MLFYVFFSNNYLEKNDIDLFFPSSKNNWIHHTMKIDMDMPDQRNLDDEVMCQLLKKYNFRVVNDIYSILTK